MKTKTSWGKVAGWYDDLLENNDSTYQKDVILPSLLRAMSLKGGEKVLDVACGQGFFVREYIKTGAQVSGSDISDELIGIAKEKSSKEIKFFVNPADKLPFENSSFDKMSIVLALQNIENSNGVFSEANRVLKEKGHLYLVMNHPCFRIPKKSDWGFDDKKGIQYRRIDAYLSDIMTKIEMNPGEKDTNKKEYTVSFHKSLQSYFKLFQKNNFAVIGLEELISNKKSQIGPRQIPEDKARNEIPMFLLLELIKF
jgi:ubiquinone/menaquinone biosynthesis C-methylase UbiE